MKSFLLLNSFILMFSLCAAQNDSPAKISKTFSIDGAVCVTTDGKAAYFNMGGAQLKFDFNHKVAVTLTMLPSLGISSLKELDQYGKEKTSINAVPVLGIGPQVFIRRFIFSFPFYYKAKQGIWVATAGIGYRIQVAKTK